MRGRAIIMARFALGAASGLTEKSGIDRSTLAFWADGLLADHAIETKDAATYVDLWTETQAALDDIVPMEALTSPADFPRVREWAGPISLLASFERVAAWTVA